MFSVQYWEFMEKNKGKTASLPLKKIKNRYKIKKDRVQSVFTVYQQVEVAVNQISICGVIIPLVKRNIKIEFKNSTTKVLGYIYTGNFLLAI